MDEASPKRAFLRRPATVSQALTLTVLVGLLPLLVASFLQASASWRDTQAIADAQLAATARTIAERTRDPFVIARHALMTVSTLPDVRDMTSGCTAGLTSARTTDRIFNNFVRADASGAVRCSILPFIPGTTLAADDWWPEAMARGGLSITQPTIGRVAKKPVIIVVLAMIGPDGAKNGSVSAGVELASIEEGIQGQPEGRSGFIAVLDGNGRAFAVNRPLALGRVDVGSALGVATARDGSEWHYALAPLYNGDMFIMYAEPQRQVMSTALSNIRYSIIIPLLAIVFACIAIWLGSDYFVLRWLRKLQDAVTRFARGDYSADRQAFAAAPNEVRAAGDDLYAMASAIRARDADLTTSLETQKQLTREIHHRVKNNLQIVTSLLTLQAGRLRDPAAREALGQTRARVSALGLIYRLLYDHGSNPEAGEVAADSLIGELCAQLRASHHAQSGVTLHCSAVRRTILIDQAVPLTLFIVEAVTNAYRHAFPERAGSIAIKLEESGGRITLSVSDSGTGYDPATVAGQMGSDLMAAFAVQLNGEFVIERAEEGGTKVVITFEP